MILVTYVLVKPGEDAMVSSPDQYCPLPSHIIVLYHSPCSGFCLSDFSSRGREQPPHCVALFRLKFSLVCWTSQPLLSAARPISCSTNQLLDQSAALPTSRRAGQLNSFKVMQKNAFLLRYASGQRGRVEVGPVKPEPGSVNQPTKHPKMMWPRPAQTCESQTRTASTKHSLAGLPIHQR